MVAGTRGTIGLGWTCISGGDLGLHVDAAAHVLRPGRPADQRKETERRSLQSACHGPSLAGLAPDRQVTRGRRLAGGSGGCLVGRQPACLVAGRDHGLVSGRNSVELWFGAIYRYAYNRSTNAMLQATDDPKRRYARRYPRLVLQLTSYNVQDTFMRFRRPPTRSAIETKPIHDPEEMRLIYDLVQHEDEMFYQRSNLFLVAESMVLVAYSLLVSRAGEIPVRGEVIASFGLIVSLIWAWASHRALVILRYVTIRAMKEHPYYRRIREERPNQRLRFMGSTKLMAYAIPAIAIIMWTVLLFT